MSGDPEQDQDGCPLDAGAIIALAFLVVCVIGGLAGLVWVILKLP